MEDRRTPTPPTVVIDEVIKITTWKNIRRYLVLGGLAFLVVDLVVTLSVVVILTTNARDAERSHAHDACVSIQAFADQQRAQIRFQQNQTETLQRKGFNFGIPPKEFKKLIEANKRQVAIQVHALDILTRANCKRY